MFKALENYIPFFKFNVSNDIVIKRQESMFFMRSKYLLSYKSPVSLKSKQKGLFQKKSEINSGSRTTK